MDDSGSVLMLPYDLTLPFARYAAHKDIVSLKRYNVARVYRYGARLLFSCPSLPFLTRACSSAMTLHSKNPAGGQPRELFECDFDIIGPVASRSVHDAETIKVLVEVLDEFSKQLGPYSIKVLHSLHTTPAHAHAHAPPHVQLTNH
jgi:translation initiation factor 2-alpha kinase 4